jgi:hypothetical protein
MNADLDGHEFCDRFVVSRNHKFFALACSIYELLEFLEERVDINEFPVFAFVGHRSLQNPIVSSADGP